MRAENQVAHPACLTRLKLAVDYRPAVDFGYWNPGNQPHDRNQPRQFPHRGIEAPVMRRMRRPCPVSSRPGHVGPYPRRRLPS